MGHGHDHSPSSYGAAFAVGITLNLAFVVVEVVYGRLSHSLALIADAGHNFTDVFGLGLAWGATLLSRKRATADRTYGFRRSSILAALINAVVLLIGVGAIGWEAITRLSDPQPVAETTVMWVAGVGILINGGTALLFMPGGNKDLNIRGAFVHLASDALIAAGVVLAAFAMLKTGLLWIDPAASLIIVALVTYGTWGLLRDSINLALDKVPQGIDIEEVKRYLASLPTCTDVHDLHVWGTSTTEAALTAHIVLEECDDSLLANVAKELHDRFGIEHTTLQVESGDPAYPCTCQFS
ncbi:MAG: cation transporter [Acidobacteria bacterium]|nr:cation transporter [Acidobacteriota bacterium]